MKVLGSRQVKVMLEPQTYELAQIVARHLGIRVEALCGRAVARGLLKEELTTERPHSVVESTSAEALRQTDEHDNTIPEPD